VPVDRVIRAGRFPLQGKSEPVEVYSVTFP